MATLWNSKMQTRSELVAMLKAAGKDLFENADRYVPENTTFMQSFNVWLKFTPDELPSMNIDIDYMQKDVIDILRGKGDQNNG